MGHTAKVILAIVVIAGMAFIAFGVIYANYEDGWFKGWMLAIAGIAICAVVGLVRSLK